MQDTVGLTVNHLHAGVVVCVGDVGRVHALLLVRRPLRLEHVLVEEELEFLVAVVDAKLFERINSEDLEPEDVQDADVCADINAGSLKWGGGG